MNQKDLVHLCEQHYGYNVIEVSFETLSLKEQVAFMRNVNVLVGATGTGLFNLLFMEKQIPAESQHHIVILFPYGKLPQPAKTFSQLACIYISSTNAVYKKANLLRLTTHC